MSNSTNDRIQAGISRPGTRLLILLCCCCFVSLGAALPPQTTGTVHFPISTASHEAQVFFDQGIKNLLGLWYQRAEHCFRRASILDPEHPMPHWGRAMASIQGNSPFQEFRQQAIQYRERATPHERLWIDALEAFDFEIADNRSIRWAEHWVSALPSIVKADPKNLEAKALLAFFLQELALEKKTPISPEFETITAQLKESNPSHPIDFLHKFLWHPDERTQALTSATRCVPGKAGVAPLGGIPGELNAQRQEFAAAAALQEFTIRAHNTIILKQEFHENTFNRFADTREGYIRNLLVQGRANEAIEMAKQMIEFPRHPNFNRVTRLGSCASYGRLRLLEALSEFELWDELSDLSKSTLAPVENDFDKGLRQSALARVAFHTKSLSALEVIRQQTQRLLQQGNSHSTDKTAELLHKETVLPNEISDLLHESGAPVGFLQSVLQEIQVYESILQKDFPTAMRSLEQATHLKPWHRARLLMLVGETQHAFELLDQLILENPHHVLILGSAVELYAAAGRTAAAEIALSALAQAAPQIDFELPLFERVQKIADKLDASDIWSKHKPAPSKQIFPTNIGPKTWHPEQATNWKLELANGEFKALDEYRGKSLLLVFYLGYGCAHCVEQLVLLHPRTEEFKRLNVEVAAISTESQEEVKASLGKSEILGELSFPLLANQELDIFQAYHAFDSREKKALHGTFLIDPTGQIRWGDISSEPFTQIDFLLAETERLLGTPRPDTAPRL